MAQSLRITIGGIEVDALSARTVSKQIPERSGAGSGDAPMVAHARPVSIAMAGENGLPRTCPIPPGPWRLVGAIALTIAVLAMVAAIFARPRPR